MERWVVRAEDRVQYSRSRVDLVDGRLEVVFRRVVRGQMVRLLVVDPARVDGRHINKGLGELGSRGLRHYVQGRLGHVPV